MCRKWNGYYTSERNLSPNFFSKNSSKQRKISWHPNNIFWWIDSKRRKIACNIKCSKNMHFFRDSAKYQFVVISSHSILNSGALFTVVFIQAFLKPKGTPTTGGARKRQQPPFDGGYHQKCKWGQLADIFYLPEAGRPPPPPGGRSQTPYFCRIPDFWIIPVILTGPCHRRHGRFPPLFPKGDAWLPRPVAAEVWFSCVGPSTFFFLKKKYIEIWTETETETPQHSTHLSTHPPSINNRALL